MLKPESCERLRAPSMGLVGGMGALTAIGSSDIERLDPPRWRVMSVSDISEISFPEYSMVCETLLWAVRPRASVLCVRGMGWSLGSGDEEPSLSSWRRRCSCCCCMVRSKPEYVPVALPPGLASSNSSSSCSIRASVRIKSTHSSASFRDLASRW